MKSKFIVIEGLECSGKTNAIIEINKTLKLCGIDKFINTREPGGTPISEILRKIIKKKNNKKEYITYQSELLILYAARSQLIENIIKPALNNGNWVISDRHDLSSQAYQGGGRKIDQNIINILSNFVLKELKPDLIIFLDISPEISFKRIQKRGNTDRIEIEKISFFKRTYKKYKDIISKNKKIITINANKSKKDVNKKISKIIKKFLNKNIKKK